MGPLIQGLWVTVWLASTTFLGQPDVAAFPNEELDLVGLARCDWEDRKYTELSIEMISRGRKLEPLAVLSERDVKKEIEKMLGRRPRFNLYSLGRKVGWFTAVVPVFWMDDEQGQEQTSGPFELQGKYGLSPRVDRFGLESCIAVPSERIVAEHCHVGRQLYGDEISSRMQLELPLRSGLYGVSTDFYCKGVENLLVAIVSDEVVGTRQESCRAQVRLLIVNPPYDLSKTELIESYELGHYCGKDADAGIIQIHEFDGEPPLEIVAYEYAYPGSRYRVYSKRKGEWKSVFSGGWSGD